MTAVTVSDKGQVVRAEIVRTVVPTKLEDGYGMLVCTSKGARTLADFDIAKAMRKARRLGLKPDVVVPLSR